MGQEVVVTIPVCMETLQRILVVHVNMLLQVQVVIITHQERPVEQIWNVMEVEVVSRPVHGKRGHGLGMDKRFHVSLQIG